MNVTNEITNSEDIIDSRDVIARIAELERDLPPSDEADGTDNDEREELAALVALAEEASAYAPDWEYGAALIRETYFTQYAEELCKDIGDEPDNIPDYIAIDWEQTAENIKVDYTEVDFDGVAYLVR